MGILILSILYVPDVPFSGQSPVFGTNFEASLGLFNILSIKIAGIGRVQLSIRFPRISLNFLLHLYFLIFVHLKLNYSVLSHRYATVKIRFLVHMSYKHLIEGNK